VVDFLKNRGSTSASVAHPKGVLLVGPPGTGKTLLARAVAGEPTCRSSSSPGPNSSRCSWGWAPPACAILSSRPRRRHRGIVFIDELDAIGKTRAGNTGFLSGHDEREQTLNQLLAEMDGFDSSKGVIIMAATNRPEVLDAALLRAGRFDRQVVVGQAGREGTRGDPGSARRNVKLAPSVDLHVLAARTRAWAGADLANLINEPRSSPRARARKRWTWPISRKR